MNEKKSEMVYRLLFQLLTAASSFSSMAEKMDVLNQVNHGLVAFEKPVQLLLRVIGKVFFSIWPFDTHPHLPSPPVSRSTALCAAVPN